MRAASLRVALTATKLWHGGPGSLVLLLDGLAGLTGAFGTEASRVLDNLDGRLRTVTMRDLLADVEREEARAHADMYERIARAVHHVYLRNQRERGVGWGEVPAMVRWEDLPEDLRASNRGWVVGLPARLARMGATIAPRDGAPEVVFEGAELDRLAEAEHELWESVRVAQGWRSGPVRDDVAPRAPDDRRAVVGAARGEPGEGPRRRAAAARDPRGVRAGGGAVRRAPCARRDVVTVQGRARHLAGWRLLPGRRGRCPSTRTCAGEV